MINLINHIANKSEEVILPIVRGLAIYKGRKIKFHHRNHGWYVIRIGNSTEIVREASRKDMRDLKIKTFLGFSFENSIVPFNFENFHRYSLTDSEPVMYYNRMEDPWNLIRVAYTEDKNLIYLSSERNLKANQILRSLKEAFETESPIQSISGITPEMTFLFFSYNFLRAEARERERIQRLMIEQAEREQKLKEMENTIEGRIRLALHASNATLVSWSSVPRSTNINVVWEINTGGRNQRISSVVRRDTLAMTRDGLGFCASGYDNTQSLKSAPMLAEKYIEDAGGLHITRYVDGNRDRYSFDDYDHDDDDYDDDY